MKLRAFKVSIQYFGIVTIVMCIDDSKDDLEIKELLNDAIKTRGYSGDAFNVTEINVNSVNLKNLKVADITQILDYCFYKNNKEVSNI